MKRILSLALVLLLLTGCGAQQTPPAEQAQARPQPPARTAAAIRTRGETEG